jgi:hypothetical protein
VQYFLSTYVSNVPPATALQLKRTKYLVDKHIFGKPDAPERLDFKQILKHRLVTKASMGAHQATAMVDGHVNIASSFYALTGSAPPSGTEPLFESGSV